MRKEIVYRRHVVDRMPIDAWNDIWGKLHQQLVNVDIYHVDTVPAEVYSSVATAVVWGMRLALAIGVYIWIDNRMRPIYAKLIPCDLGTPPTKMRQPLKRKALGSLGKSRYVTSNISVVWMLKTCLKLFCAVCCNVSFLILDVLHSSKWSTKEKCFYKCSL